MVPKFEKCPRNSEELLLDKWDNWRLATKNEMQENRSHITNSGILDSTDTSRLLEGCVKEGFRSLTQYSPNLKHMLLVQTSVSRKSQDGNFHPDMYSGVQLSAKGRTAALLLSCEDKITEIICFVLHSIVEKVEKGKRQEELDRLTKNLDDNFRNGRTVLHYAVDQPHNQKHGMYVAECLKNCFRDGKKLIKAADKYGRTALHLAALHGNIELCQFLLDTCGLEVDTEDENGENALHFAVRGNTSNVFQKFDHLLGVKKTIERSVDAQRKTALHKAAARGSEEIIRILLSSIGNDTDKNAYVCQADLFGQTALLEAVREGHVDSVQLLLKNGSNPLCERDFDGKSALHYAVQLSNEVKAKRMVKLLMEHYKREETLPEHEKAKREKERSLLLWAPAAGIGTADEYLEQRDGHLGTVLEFLRKERMKSANSLDELFVSAIELKHMNVARELVIKRGVNAARIKRSIGSLENSRRVDEVLRKIEKVPERGQDQPALYDSLGRTEFAEGLATLFLNPNVKSPLTVGISGDWGIGKSSLMIQTEIILLKTAAQLAFPSLLDTNKFPKCAQIEQSPNGQTRYEEINDAVKKLKLLPSAAVSEDDPLVQFLNQDYQSEHHEVYKSLALIDRKEMIQRKGDDKGADSNSNQQTLTSIPSILTVRYNAWYYQSEQEAWAGLAVEITKAIEESMTRAQRVRCRWRYVRKEHGDKILFEFILPCLLALFFSSWVAWAVWKLLTRTNNKDLQDLKYGSIPSTILVVLWSVARQLFSVFQPINVQISRYLQLPSHITNLGYQHQVISDIKFMLDEVGEKPSRKWRFIAGLWSFGCLNPDTVKGTSIPKLPPPCNANIRTIVFVDDLDRCKDNVILTVLSAVNLVLAACNINVVLGMDVKMIARATESMFPNKNNNPEELAEKYISKIVQLQLALPDTSEAETKKFLNEQMGPPFNPAFDSEFKTVTNQRVGHEQPSADSDQDCVCVCLDIRLTEEGQSFLKKVYQKFESIRRLKNCICRCFPEAIANSFWHKTSKGKLNTMLFNIETITRNYSMEERIALECLSSSATGSQRLPREWKRFLTYHRVAWHILHQSKQLKNTLGWEAQLVIWVFCCSQWKRQINDVIKNWKTLRHKTSLKTIIEDYYSKIWLPLHHVEDEEDQVEEERDLVKDEGRRKKKKDKPKKTEDDTKKGNKDKPMKTEDDTRKDNEEKLKQEEEKEEWLSLINTLQTLHTLHVNTYDVSKESILYFQKFRLNCKMGHLS